ncbi:MAG: UbiA family prenyltransferase [Pseudomonadota bacterium]
MSAQIEPVLVVDMDGTLSRTDTLHEAIFAFVSANPLRAPALFGWLSAGKAGFKARLADECIADAETLPLNDAVVDLVREAKADGRRTALVSASDQRQVDALASRVDLFDEIHGTAVGGENLSGARKAAFLTERYGEKGFDYVGDAPVDLPVWDNARRAITVGASEALRQKVEQQNDEAVHLEPATAGAARIRPYIRALRPHQWLKNILIFMPVFAAHDFTELGAAIAAFIAFSLTASSVYLINDLLDLSADRAHPRKRLRPFASAEIPLFHGVALAPLLILAALLISILFTNLLFIGVLAAYYIATFAYSLVLKRKLIIDVWTLGGLYTMRILAGAAATGVALSPWMLAFSMFLFLSLAAVKRQAELTDQINAGKTETAGRAYRADDLPILYSIALSAGYASVVVFALYINSPKVSGLYARPELLWLVCPLLLYWVSRMVMVTHRGDMTDDPIIYAARDRISMIVVALAGVSILFAGVL